MPFEIWQSSSRPSREQLNDLAARHTSRPAEFDDIIHRSREMALVLQRAPASLPVASPS